MQVKDSTALMVNWGRISGGDVQLSSRILHSPHHSHAKRQRRHPQSTQANVMTTTDQNAYALSPRPILCRLARLECHGASSLRNAVVSQESTDIRLRAKVGRVWLGGWTRAVRDLDCHLTYSLNVHVNLADPPTAQLGLLHCNWSVDGC